MTCSNKIFDLFTEWKVSKYGAFSSPYFPAFGLNTDQKKLRIWTHFTQWLLMDIAAKIAIDKYFSYFQFESFIREYHV